MRNPSGEPVRRERYNCTVNFGALFRALFRANMQVRGSREGWASHFLSRAIPFIIEFVSGSQVAELIQHQKVIDYTATYNG